MGFGLQWLVDKITFPSPPSSYSLTSHPELFFIKGPKARPAYPGVPCMLYAIPQGAPVLLVHAHSNGCDIGDMRQTLQNISESLRVHVMSFEFPGYGLHVGSASMRSIDEAAILVADYIINEMHVNISQVVWYGRSIGSGPALRMVHRISKELHKQPGGVVLQCGYANFPEVAGHLFGRVAKQLVSPLWPNEAMVKDIQCPVLLIHGRNDTMIPIEQSQKLWNAVKAKEQSHFHACDCGHNDFNFRRCTLRPIYDFLLGVISHPSFPATNFQLEIHPSTATYVHHIGPLRPKIPVYSFRRPELEEWLRKTLRQGQPEEGVGSEELSAAAHARQFRPGQRIIVHGLQGQEAGHNGKQGHLLVLEEQEGRWRLRLDSGEMLLLPPANLCGVGEAAEDKAEPEKSLKAQGRELQKQESGVDPTASQSSSPALANASNSSTTAQKGRKEKKAKAPEPEVLPIPDFSKSAPIEDATQVLLDPEGMVRTCAVRVAAFLERVQGQLNRVEGLESKLLEEVIDMVEAEFWAADPLLGIWEEVSLPHGDRVRIRLGPFSVDNRGERAVDHGLSTGSSSPPAGWLRTPIWLFCPSPAHFRCLAEGSLLNSERLERNLPAGSHSAGGSGCCCVPSGRLTSRRRPKVRGGGRFGDQPTRGVLATSLAAHFAHWVEKTDDVKAMFMRFASLYTHPEKILRRPVIGMASISTAPKEALGDFPPRSPGSNSSFDDEAQDLTPAEELPARGGEVDMHTRQEHGGPGPAAGRRVPLQTQSSAVGLQAGTDKEENEVDAKQTSTVALKHLFPLAPAHFSASSRASLREGVGGLGSPLAELHEQIWGFGSSMQGSICDFAHMAELVANDQAVPSASELDRHTDWTAASLLLQYERVLWGGAASSASIAAGTAEEGQWGDPVRADVRKTALAMNKAVKAFAHAEQRERRESQQQTGPRLGKPQPRIPQQPSGPDGPGAPEPPPPAPPASGATPSPSLGAGAVPKEEAQPPGVAGDSGV